VLKRCVHPLRRTTGRRSNVPFPLLSISAMVFVRATEDEEKVMKALELVLPPEKERKRMKLRIERRVAKGVLGNPIIILEARATRKSDARKWWKHILSLLSEKDLEYITNHPDDFMDEFGVVHLRFDKQKAYEGVPVLTGGGGVIKIRAQLEAYPAKVEEFRKAFFKLFERGQ